MVGVPLYIGGCAGVIAVAAAVGTLGLAIAAAIAGGAWAGIGALLAAAIARHHSTSVQEQLKKGGLVLWVSVSCISRSRITCPFPTVRVMPPGSN